MDVREVQVVPLAGASDSPMPPGEDDEVSDCLATSVLFHEILVDLLPTIRTEEVEKVTVVARGGEYPVSHPLDLLYTCRRGRDVVELLADHSSSAPPSAMLDDASPEEVTLFREVCLALNASVPIVEWASVLEHGHATGDVVVDLVAQARGGVWLRGSNDDEWFRTVVPGRLTGEPQYPLHVMEVRLSPGGVVLVGVEANLVVLFKN